MNGLSFREAKVPFYDRNSFALVKEQLSDHLLPMYVKAAHVVRFLKGENTGSMDLKIHQEYLRIYCFEIFKIMRYSTCVNNQGNE